jgi:hypothetical protein
MPTASEAVAGVELGASPPSVELVAECPGQPEWHSLRLFGSGRHPSGFDAGVETGHGF